MNQPAYLTNAAGRPTYSETAHSPTGLPAAPSYLRCLVLAESSSLRFLIRQILSLEGWDATEEEEREAPSYQAVVADLDCFRWPAGDVSEAVQRAATRGLPVLALTGQDLNPQQYAALGCPGLLAKPFELTAFLQVLHSWAARLTAAEC